MRKSPKKCQIEILGAARTYAHDHQESSHETPKIHNGRAGIVHEIIWIGAPTANPVRQWRDHVSCNDEKWQVVVV